MILIIYNLFLIIIALVLLPLILIAFIIKPKFRAGFFQKIGFYSYKNEGKKTVVFHAVSVGETNAVKELIKQYKIKHPDKNIVVTTTTKTGQELAKKMFKDIAVKVTYFPYDFFFSVLSFLNTFKPEKIIVAETEIWPSLAIISKLMGVMLYTVNGRISPHSYEGYKKIKLFLIPILNSYEKFFMQSSSDEKRMIDLGAESNKVEVMGNLKFDIQQNLNENEVRKYENELKTVNYKVFIGASTHKGEDEIVIKAYKKLKENHNEAKMIIAPRHPERFQEVSTLLQNEEMNWGKRTEGSNFNEVDVILLDTMGELSKLFSICYIAFIGGSFSSTGGHNPLEANIWGKPVISGPMVFNFKDVYKIACDNKCAIVVQSGEELKNELISFYDNDLKYKTYCSNAKEIFDKNKGAIKYVLEKI